MKLEDKIKQLQYSVIKHKMSLERDEKELSRLQGCRQPSNKELYDESLYDISIKNDEYEYILGGDGRSAPWSETRKGMVATAVLKNGIYLDELQIEIIRNYIKNTKNPDCIRLVRND